MTTSPQETSPDGESPELVIRLRTEYEVTVNRTTTSRPPYFFGWRNPFSLRDQPLHLHSLDEVGEYLERYHDLPENGQKIDYVSNRSDGIIYTFRYWPNSHVARLGFDTRYVHVRVRARIDGGLAESLER